MSRVLVVDDEPDIRLMVRIALEQRGWVVDESTSGRDAIDRCASRRYDAIVLDMRMPRMDGMEVARRIRDRGDGTPILLFSAFLEPETEEQARAAGFVPVPKDDLGQLVRTLPDSPAVD